MKLPYMVSVYNNINNCPYANYNYSTALKGLLVLKDHCNGTILSDIVKVADRGVKAVASIIVGHTL